jgi:hypothetical protein
MAPRGTKPSRRVSDLNAIRVGNDQKGPKLRAGGPAGVVFNHGVPITGFPPAARAEGAAAPGVASATRARVGAMVRKVQKKRAS